MRKGVDHYHILYRVNKSTASRDVLQIGKKFHARTSRSSRAAVILHDPSISPRISTGPIGTYEGRLLIDVRELVVAV